METKLKAFVVLTFLTLFACGQTAYAAISVDEDRVEKSIGDSIVEKTDGYMEDNVTVKGASSTLIFGKGAEIITEGNRSSSTRVSGLGSSIIFGEKAAIFTNGAQSNGAYVDGKGSLIVFKDGASVTTKGEEARGVVVVGLNAQISLANGAVIKTHGKNAYGAFANAQGSRIEFGNRTNITTGSYRAHGAVANRNDSRIKFGSETTITTGGEEANGAHASGNATQISFGSRTTITTTAKSAHGAVSGGAGGDDKSLIDFGANAKVNTTGARAHGAYSYGKDARITFEEGAEITTRGVGAYGVTTRGRGSSASFKDKAVITTRGIQAYGVYAVTDRTTISFGGDSVITTKGADASAVVAIGSNAQIFFGSNSNSPTYDSSARVTPSRTSQLTTKGNSAHGVYAKGTNSLVTFAADASLVTEGSGAHGAYTDNPAAGIAFNGNTIIQTAREDSYALFAKQGSITSTRSNKYTINGDIVAEAGTIRLKMSEGSSFTGKTNAGSGATSLAARNSNWNVTGTSKLTSLTLDSSVVDYGKASLGTTITVGNLDGSGGTFNMKTDIEKEISDKLVVTGKMNGSQHKIRVSNQGGTATTGNEIVKLVDTADEAGKFELANDVELGGFRYMLRQVNGVSGSQWELYSKRMPSTDIGTDHGRIGKALDAGGSGSGTQTVISTDTGNGPDTEYSGGIGFKRTTSPVTIAADNIGQLSSTADAAINTFYANYLLSYTEMQTLIQRLGDLRETPWNSGFWFRAHGGKLETSERVLLDSFDMDYGGVQIGYDRKFAAGTNGDLYAGVMFGYSKGDISYLSGGSGDVNSKMLGIYGTYLRSNGFFVDAVLKYQWMDNDFNVIDSVGNHVNVDKINTDAVGASLEIGQRIHFGKDHKSGWYVEPQAQISYTRHDGGYFNASNGLHVGVESSTSVLGRLGLLAGYETERSNFYAKVSKVKEFDGDVTIGMNSNPMQDSFEDSWWVYGIGFTSKVNDRNSMYFDLERTHGGEFKQTWALKAGWRIVF